MPLEDFIITVFCWVEEHLNALLGDHRGRQRGFAPKLTDREVITREVVGEFLGLDTELVDGSLTQQGDKTTAGISKSKGIERHLIENIEVPVYSPAKTIIDCFRYRNKIGLDLALEGLREGLRRRCCTPDQLWRYAQTTRLWSVMRSYVEALVADG